MTERTRTDLTSFGYTRTLFQGFHTSFSDGLFKLSICVECLTEIADGNNTGNGFSINISSSRKISTSDVKVCQRGPQYSNLSGMGIMGKMDNNIKSDEKKNIPGPYSDLFLAG